MEDFWALILLTSAISGALGYFFAVRTGRNPLLWGALGCMLNVVGVIVISFAAASRRRRMAAGRD
jgi:hypothetical protein